uniref:Uncharacterized protein n=1 Tax=Oryza nivara TaxID=4536 RepID=A0A0E0FPA6_ORYNI
MQQQQRSGRGVAGDAAAVGEAKGNNGGRGAEPPHLSHPRRVGLVPPPPVAGVSARLCHHRRRRGAATTAAAASLLDEDVGNNAATTTTTTTGPRRRRRRSALRGGRRPGRRGGWGKDYARVAAVSGNAQQHGSVYWKHVAAAVLASLDLART